MFRLVSHLQADFEMTKFTWVMLLHLRMTHFVFEHKKHPLSRLFSRGVVGHILIRYCISFYSHSVTNPVRVLPIRAASYRLRADSCAI